MEQEILPSSNNLDNILRTMAQPKTKDSFSFHFGNKRGRPIPPRPPVISAVKVRIILCFISFDVL